MEFPSADFSTYTCGQFVHIKIPNYEESILRRPISIFGVDADKRTVSVVYQIAGEGTRRLSTVPPNASIDALLFLGNGFTLPKGAKNVLCIGGGIGCAPFGGVIQSHPSVDFSGIFGFRAQSALFMEQYFVSNMKSLHIATEDGSYGTKGFLTEILRNTDLSGFDCFLLCGPTSMLKASSAFVLKGETPAFASLEERMGCGMGGCSVCVCKTLSGDYEKVCTSGPVFDLRRIAL